MSSSIIRWASIVVCVGACASLAAGEGAKPRKKVRVTKKAEDNEKKGPVEADKDATAAMDRSVELTYFLDTAGIKKATCKGTATVQAQGQTLKGDVGYDFDATVKPPKGKLTFQDATAEARMKQVLPPIDGIFYDDEPWRTMFAGCKLTAAKDGGKTKVQIEGKNKPGFKSMTFNADGMLEEASLEFPDELKALPGMDASAELVLKMTYVKFGDKFAPAKATAKAGTTTIQEMVFEYAPLKKYNVLRKASSTRILGPMKISGTVSFTDIQLEDESGTIKSDEKKADAKKAPKAKADKAKKPAKSSD